MVSFGCGMMVEIGFFGGISIRNRGKKYVNLIMAHSAQSRLKADKQPNHRR
jgi:hypothetical protein